MIYRSISLLAGLKGSPFAGTCHYDEATSTRGLAPFALGQRFVAEMLSRSFNAMVKLINRDGVIDQLGRAAIKQLMDWIGPKPGQPPSEKHLEESGYPLRMKVTSASGTVVRGHATVHGHPGYRSTAMRIAGAGLLQAGAGAPDCRRCLVDPVF